MQTRPITDLYEARSITDRPEDTLRDYHYRRANRLLSGEFDVEDPEHPVVLLHVASPTSLNSYTDDRIDVREFTESHRDFPAVVRGDSNTLRGKHCSRGYVADDCTDSEYTAATWVDRTGILESVSANVFYSPRNEDKYKLSHKRFEKSIVDIVDAYTDHVNDALQEGVLVVGSYHNLENTGITIQSRYQFTEFDTSFIETPVVELGNGDIRGEIDPIIRPVWNAIGRGVSPHMDEDGEWTLAN